MNSFDSAWTRISPLLLAVVVSLSAFSLAARRGNGDATNTSQDVVQIAIAPGGVQWSPQRDFESATLIVSGPGGATYRERFQEGSSPWFAVDETTPRPDGLYFWEIRLTPKVSAAVEQELREIAETYPMESADRLKQTEELNRANHLRHRELLQSGQFRVRDGLAIAEAADAEERLPDIDPMTATLPGTRGPLAGYDVSGNWSVTGSLAVGTDVPTQPLDIVSADPAIRLHDSDGAGYSWHLYGGGDGFDVRANSKMTSKRVFFLDANAPAPSVWIDGSGKWGNGTAMPAAPFHLLRSDGTAKFLVQEASPVPLSRSLLELQNNGGTFFSVRNTAINSTWSFSVSAVGAFQIDNPLLGAGAEMVFFDNGSVRMGPGGTQRFLLDPSGNLIISGNLTASGMSYPSDRSLKENIAPLDARGMLDRLATLPINSWNYKSDPEATRHVGPMAQDFQAAFSVGSDGRRINVMDATGVTLAAVQGVYELLKEQQAQIQRQQAEIDILRARLDRLEQR